MRLGFRAKLLASYVGLVAGVTAVLLFFLGRTLGDDLRAELDTRLEQQAVGAAQWIGAGRHPDRVAGRLAVVVGARVTIFDSAGAVVGDSETEAALPDESGAPELVAARGGTVGRATRAVGGREMHFVAVRANEDLVLRLAVPLSGIEATIGAMRQRLLLATALAVVAALGLGLVASRVASRPLRAMTDAAGRIAQGDYDIDVATQAPDEFGMLSRSLAALARQLDERIGDLTAERDRLSAILAGMAEGVIVADQTGRVLLANPAAAEILGPETRAGRAPGDHDAAPAATLVGRPIDEAIALPSLRDLVARAVAKGATLEADPLPGDREGRSLAVYVRPLGKEGGGGVVAVLRDMTQIRRFETMRRDFVANVSHELRTPVTAIQGYAETILRGTDEKTTRGFLEVVHRHAIRLGRLLEDLLRLAALEGRSPDDAVREPVPLRPLAEQVATTVAARAAVNSVSVTTAIDEGTIALGDPTGIEQVLENLVDNAVKYAGPNTHVRMEGERSGDHVVLRVVDDGAGVEARHLPRLFERFYRVDAGRAREQGGTGLGLAIVKHLVEGMGGAISVESEPGRGTRFSVTLPAGPA